MIMAALTNEQIEQKKQKLSEILKEAKTLQDELMEAGAIPIDDDELDGVAGGRPGTGVDSSTWVDMQGHPKVRVSDNIPFA